MDSIVRQSRHQFGSDKDVFAPRFTKNIVSTFQHLFKCPPEEKVCLTMFTFGFLTLQPASENPLLYTVTKKS